jgi:hypothetical protein
MIETNINTGSRYWFPQKIYISDGSQFRDVRRMFVYDDVVGWKECFRNLLTPVSNITSTGCIFCNGTYFTLRSEYSAGTYSVHLYTINMTTMAGEFFSTIYSGPTSRVFSFCVDGNSLYLTASISGVTTIYLLVGTSLVSQVSLPLYRSAAFVCGGAFFYYDSGYVYAWNALLSRWDSAGAVGITDISNPVHLYNVGGALFAGVGWTSGFNGYQAIKQWNGGTSWSTVGPVVSTYYLSLSPNFKYVNGAWYCVHNYDDTVIKVLSGGAWINAPGSETGFRIYLLGVVGNKILCSSNLRNASSDMGYFFDTNSNKNTLISLRGAAQEPRIMSYGTNNMHRDNHGGKLIVSFYRSGYGSYSLPFVWDGDLP